MTDQQRHQSSLCCRIEVCPDCYHERRRLVPISSYSYKPGGLATYVLPDGTPVDRAKTDETATNVRLCQLCGWKQEGCPYD